MSDLAQTLIDIKDEIEKLEKEKAVTEGRLAELMSALKEEWQCDTVEMAEKELAKFNKHIEKLGREMDEIADELIDLGWEV